MSIVVAAVTLLLYPEVLFTSELVKSVSLELDSRSCCGKVVNGDSFL